MSGRNWGRWGPDDERGTLNLATPAAIRRAARAVDSGIVYSLALPMSRTRTPAVFGRPSPERLTRSGPDDVLPRGAGAPAVGPSDEGAARVGTNEDVLMFSSHAGTHMDALSHVFAGNHFYNGHPVGSFSTRKGASRLGITTTCVFAGRGVMLDVLALRGDPGATVLPAGTTISADDLQQCCDSQGIGIEPGDAVLVRTGWAEIFAGEPSTPGFPQAGIGIEAARWLADHDVSVVGADNSAVEVLPFEGGQALPVHRELIVSCGVSLLEHLFLGGLATAGCDRFFLVVAALPVLGATGSPVNPIAIA